MGFWGFGVLGFWVPLGVSSLGSFGFHLGSLGFLLVHLGSFGLPLGSFGLPLGVSSDRLKSVFSGRP